MNKTDFPLPSEILSPAAQGWYLLLDRTLANLLAAEEVPATAGTVLEDAFFAHDPDKAPVLLDLSAASWPTVEQRRSWVQMGVDGIRHSLFQGGSAMVAGWLYSTRPVEQVRRHLRRLLAQPHPDGQMHHLRYYDPRISRLLDESLSPAQRNQLLGPIDAWWYAVYSGGYRRMAIDSALPREGSLVLTPHNWQALDQAAHYHQLVRYLAGLNELYPDVVPFDGLPDFAMACALFQRAAAQPWVDNHDDMVGCTLLWLVLGPDCCERYPDVTAELQQYQRDRLPALCEWLLFAGAAFWNKPVRLPGRNNIRGAIA